MLHWNVFIWDAQSGRWKKSGLICSFLCMSPSPPQHPHVFVRGITASDWDDKSSTDKWLGWPATRLLISVLSSFRFTFHFIPTGFCVSATEAHNKPSRSKCRLAEGKATTRKWYVREQDNYCDNMQPLLFFGWRVLRTRRQLIGRAIERGWGWKQWSEVGRQSVKGGVCPPLSLQHSLLVRHGKTRGTFSVLQFINSLIPNLWWKFNLLPDRKVTHSVFKDWRFSRPFLRSFLLLSLPVNYTVDRWQNMAMQDNS